MAVQAQYPSNALFFNRNGQERHDYSMQPQPGGGGFIDQTHILFHNGGSNPRKRARDVSPGDFSVSPQMNHQLSLQAQPPQIIDLSLLHNRNNNQQQQLNVVSTGLRLASGEEQIQQLHHGHDHLFLPQKPQEREPQSLVSGSSLLISPLVREDITGQIKRQRDELDIFIQAQGDELRRTVAEKRRAHYRALLCAVEEPLARRLREKEAEFEKATRRNQELESSAAQLAAEAQAWQSRARAQEAAVVSLQAQLHRAMAAAAAQDRAAGEGGLMCAGSRADATEDAESAFIDPDRVEASGPLCRSCRGRAATVVVLPCRHLCLCPACDRAALGCPVCLAVRNSSVEVFFS